MNTKLLNYYLNLIGYQSMPEFLKKYLKTPCLLRLKKVGYFCGMDYASKEIYHFKEPISRYDHSLSVALLTWRYTKDKKTTIAGLFHDIATPCFSHVIDYMNKDYTNQESTEEYTEKILKQDSYLLSCLKKDEISIDDIVNFKRYTIVDNDRPKLCVDRLDGVILTGISWIKTINEEKIEAIINDTQVFINEEENPEVGFKTKETAEMVVEINQDINRYCHSKEDNYMMELLANITRNAIKEGNITYDELYTLNEEELITKLKNCNNKVIVKEFNKFETIKREEIPEVNLPQVKIRKLNPLVNNARLK